MKNYIQLLLYLWCISSHTNVIARWRYPTPMGAPCCIMSHILVTYRYTLGCIYIYIYILQLASVFTRRRIIKLQLWLVCLTRDQKGQWRSTGYPVAVLHETHETQRDSGTLLAVCLWQILRVLPHSAASLKYRAANDPNTDTPPSHIILTPGQPVLVLSS